MKAQLQSLPRLKSVQDPTDTGATLSELHDQLKAMAGTEKTLGALKAFGK